MYHRDISIVFPIRWSGFPTVGADLGVCPGRTHRCAPTSPMYHLKRNPTGHFSTWPDRQTGPNRLGHQALFPTVVRSPHGWLATELSGLPPATVGAPAGLPSRQLGSGTARPVPGGSLLGNYAGYLLP